MTVNGSGFDEDLVEFTSASDQAEIALYKLGGGTLGASYQGRWAWRYRDVPTGRTTSGDDLWTGTPKTHREAAEILSNVITAATDA